MAIDLDRSPATHEPGTDRRQWWSIVTTLLVAAIFLQAVFAGLMLSGVDWARAAHALNADVIIASTLAASLTAIITLRRVPQGVKLGFTLLALMAAIFIQIALGRMSAKGANLMWVHVPLGVALVGFSAQAAALARRLGATSTF